MSKVWLIYKYLITNLIYRPFCIKMGSKVIICNPVLITPKALKLGSFIFIRDFARIEGVFNYRGVLFKPLIEIEDNVTIEQQLHLTCASKITICKNTSIAANVTITDIIHPYLDINTPIDHQPINVSEVLIGKGCKIYNNAVILPGTVLGKQCVIGANSVVLGKMYKDYCVILGSPAIVIKRFSVNKNEWLRTDGEGNFI